MRPSPHVKSRRWELVIQKQLRCPLRPPTCLHHLRPRDLYDVIHLYRRQELNPDRAQVVATLQAKCEFKLIAVPTIASIGNSPLVGELRVSWEQLLGHQLPQLPSFEDFWNELPKVFDWLFGQAAPAVLPAAPSREAVDTGEDRAYRVDRISGATASRRSFSPRYLVELTSNGPIRR